MFKLVEGLGSELGLINTLGLIFVVLAVVAILGKLGMLKLPGRRKEQTVIPKHEWNPHGPGDADVCKKHGDSLIKIGTTIDLTSRETSRRLQALERKINNGRRT